MLHVLRVFAWAWQCPMPPLLPPRIAGLFQPAPRREVAGAISWLTDRANVHDRAGPGASLRERTNNMPRPPGAAEVTFSVLALWLLWGPRRLQQPPPVDLPPNSAWPSLAGGRLLSLSLRGTDGYDWTV